MQEFTGWQYLLIDAANNAPLDLDKQTFEERIEWAESNLDILEDTLFMYEDWKEKPLYIKAVMAIRDAQAGIPSGHLVGFDAVCSGMQIMSVLTGCIDGARATGLVDNDHRADAYTDCGKLMSNILGYEVDNQRAHVKQAVMTSLYGSKKEPKNEFGDGTDALNAFYQAMYQLAPGPCELLDDLLQSWQPYALTHEWILPDGYHARCKVMQQVEEQIEVDELNHHTFTYVWYENEGEKKGVKNAANVIHSVDGYILRSLIRRCSYDVHQVSYAFQLIQQELLQRFMGNMPVAPFTDNEQFHHYREQYERSGHADVVIVPYITDWSVRALDSQHLRDLNRILETMLEHSPFDVITIHDDFKCHPNYMNYLRKHYRNILAELADSTVLDDILSQIYGFTGSVLKKSTNLADTIRQSSYALC